MGRDEIPRWHDVIARTVRRVLRRRMKDTYVIEDICQNVLAICLEKQLDLQHFSVDILSRIVVRITLNQLFSWLRQRKMHQWPEEFEVCSREEDPSSTMEKREQVLFFLAIFNGLPPLYRDVARLHVLEGWTHERIAKVKGIPVNTVKTQFRRAKALLAEAARRYFAN